MQTISKFIKETDVYELLKETGLHTPKYSVIKGGKLHSHSFKNGDSIVLKGIADELWHKSDIGALKFASFDEKEIMKLNEEVVFNVNKEHKWLETLVCEKVQFLKAPDLPSEAFVSIKDEESAGIVIRLGLGGIHTESWAKELKGAILTWPIEFISQDEAYNELKEHILGKVWLGSLRQQKPLTTEKNIRDFIHALWNLGFQAAERNIELLEMNPMVLNQDGVPTALDGVGLFHESKNEEVPLIKPHTQALLNPKRVAIAGVSKKEGSFGKRIFDNLLASKINKEKLTIIKPGTDSFEGLPCVESIEDLKEHPVDAFILALPAKVSVETIKQLCIQGGGADVVYLVAGGIGDGADKEGLADQIKHVITEYRRAGKWTPQLVGPNCLGIVLSELNLNTLFISKEKLAIEFFPKGNVNFVSQSGAFFITKFSNEGNLPIKNGFCIGNQIDVKLSDFLSVFSEDPDCQVLAVYAEGFSEGDLIQFAIKAREISKTGKKILLYKGGRSEKGMKAAAGHTGAMAGNWELQRRVLELAGVIVSETFVEFSTWMKWLSKYPSVRDFGQIALMMNAGYESVASADHNEHVYQLTDSDKEKLSKVLEENHLSSLVGASNPLDLTPMANEKAYLESARVLLETEADSLIMAFVPLTDRLSTFNLHDAKTFAESIDSLQEEFKKPIGVIIDSGKLYNEYKEVFKDQGLPVFNSIEEPLMTIRS